MINVVFEISKKRWKYLIIDNGINGICVGKFKVRGLFYNL